MRQDALRQIIKHQMNIKLGDNLQVTEISIKRMTPKNRADIVRSDREKEMQKYAEMFD